MICKQQSEQARGPMKNSVSVVLRNGELINVRLEAGDFEGLDPGAALMTIGSLYEEYGIEPESMTGKVLLRDQVLQLVQAQRPESWQDPTPQMRRFLAAALVALQRDDLTISLKDHTLGRQ
jgi:hypothetical protein